MARARKKKPTAKRKAPPKGTPSKRKAAAPGRAVPPKGGAKVRSKGGAQKKPQGSASPSRAALPKGSAQMKRSAPARTPAKAPSGGKATAPTKGRATRKLAEFAAAVKRAAPPVRAKPETKAERARKRRLSRTPEAIRARKYRAEKKAVAEALAADVETKRARRRARDRQRRERERAKREGRPEVTERDVAIGWLEEVRNHAAHVTETSLSIVEPEAASGGGVWLVCGRFDLLEAASYADLGEIFRRVVDDDLLSARVNPARLTQIRILFDDPNGARKGGDSIVSQIAGWEFAWGDLVGEIIGYGEADEDALAVRYELTTIGTFYVYLAPTIVNYSTSGPWSKTVQLPTNYQRT
jgi:hypothetical protein